MSFFESAANFDGGYYCDSEEIEVNLDDDPSYLNTRSSSSKMISLTVDDPFGDEEEKVDEDKAPTGFLQRPSPLQQTSSSGADIVRAAIQMTKAATLKANAELKRKAEMPSTCPIPKRTKREETGKVNGTKLSIVEISKPTILSTDEKSKKRRKDVVPEGSTFPEGSSKYWYYVTDDDEEDSSGKIQEQRKGKNKKINDVKIEAIPSVKTFRAIGVQTSPIKFYSVES